MPPVITLTTDFGLGSYVAQMKGVLLSICPEARIVDIDHSIAPQDVAAGAWTLLDTVGAFPPGTIHVAVVDPGVGTARRPIAVRAGGRAPGQLFVGPDNGLLSWFAQGGEVRLLENPACRAVRISSTFHGRDIFAPAAAHLARGLPFEQLGAPVADAVQLRLPQARRSKTRPVVTGEVVFTDRFGNLVTNIAASDLPSERPLVVEVPGASIPGVRNTYGDAAPGELLALVDSSGRLEIAVRDGNAAQWLALGEVRGLPVKVSW